VTAVIYRTATSLNGFIADEAGSLEWLFAVDHADVPDHGEFLARIGAIVEGSTTYEWVLGHTDVMTQPDRWTEYYGARPTFVFTSRRLPVPEGADVRFVRGPVAEALPSVYEAAGTRDVWIVGGGDLAGQFADAGALHKVEMTLAPVALGGGAPLLPRRLDGGRLALESVSRWGEFVHLVYAVSSPTEG
jgi:dihydrofolate reductase